MENTFENALKYVRHLDSIEHTWSESEKTLATAMLSYAAKTSQKSDCISNVSDIKHQSLDVNLSWKRGDPHHTIEVFNNGTLMASGWLVNKHD